jgi:hypothetical protein
VGGGVFLFGCVLGWSDGIPKEDGESETSVLLDGWERGRGGEDDTIGRERERERGVSLSVSALLGRYIKRRGQGRGKDKGKREGTEG